MYTEMNITECNANYKIFCDRQLILARLVELVKDKFSYIQINWSAYSKENIFIRDEIIDVFGPVTGAIFTSKLLNEQINKRLMIFNVYAWNNGDLNICRVLSKHLLSRDE